MMRMPVVDLLGKPAWQGIGALIALTALLAYLWFEVRRRGRRRSVGLSGKTPLPPTQPQKRPSTETLSIRPHLISDTASEKEFYDELIRLMTVAKEAFYRSGHGFQSDRQSDRFNELLRAEEAALRRGVRITRIQTGTRVATAWAEGYASLLERFPGLFKMVVDFDGSHFTDVGLIDPYGHDPKIYLTFETREAGPPGARTRPAVAMFIQDARGLATILAQQFANRTAALKTLTPQDIRDLAKDYVYFGWGVHMASRKMQRDVPDARSLGKAILHGWARDVSAVLDGPARPATIKKNPDDKGSLEGVAYELSWWGKTRLDRLERRAYRPIFVPIEVDGRMIEAFTYVPLPPSTSDQKFPPGSWIEFVAEGAVENNLVELLDELRAAGAPIDSLLHDTL